MMARKIGDAFVRIRPQVKASEFEDEAERPLETGLTKASRRAGEAAGKAGGRGLNRRLGETIKSGLSGSISVAVGGLRAGITGALSDPKLIAGIVGGVAALAPIIASTLSAALIAGSGLGFIGLGALLLKDEPRVKGAAGRLANTVKKTFAGAAKPLIGPLVQALGIFEKLAVEIGPQIRQAFADVAPAIVPLAQGLAELVRGALPGVLALVKQSAPLLTSMSASFGQLGRAIGTAFEQIAKGGPEAAVFMKDLITVLSAVIVVAGGLVRQFTANYVTLRNFFTSIPGWVAAAGSAIAGFGTSVGNFFTALPGRIGAAIAAIPGILQRAFVAAFDAAAYAVGFGIGTVLRLLAALPGRAAAAVARLWSAMSGAFTSAVGFARDNAAQLVTRFVVTVATLPGRAAAAVASVGSAIAGKLRSAVTSAYDIGQDIIRGMINGITSMIGAAVDAAKRAVGNIISGAKDALGIGSPSKVFAGFGRDSIRGYIQGLRQQTPSIDAAVSAALVPGGPFGDTRQVGEMAGLLRALLGATRDNTDAVQALPPDLASTLLGGGPSLRLLGRMR